MVGTADAVLSGLYRIKDLSFKQKQAAFKILVILGTGDDLRVVSAELACLPDRAREEVLGLMGSPVAPSSNCTPVSEAESSLGMFYFFQAILRHARITAIALKPRLDWSF